MICQDEFVSRMLILCPVQGDAGLSDYRGNLAKIVKHYFVGISDGAQISMGIRTLGPDPRPEIIFQTCQIGHMAHPRRSSTGSSWGWEVWKMSWLGPGGAWERDICAYIYIHTYYNMYIYIKEDIMMTYWKMMEHGDIASSPVDINGDNWDNQLINTSWVCIWTCGIYSPWWPLKSDNDDPS